MRLLDAGNILRPHWKWLLALPTAAAISTFGITSLMTPEFTATAKIFPPNQQSGTSSILGTLSGLSGLAGAAVGLKNPTDQWISILKSRTIADQICKHFDLKKAYGTTYDADARAYLATKTKISSGKDGLIDIEFDDIDPNRAKNIVSAYITELERLSVSLNITEASQRRTFFEAQLKDSAGKLTKAEESLKEAGINPNVLKTDPQASLSAVADLQAKIAAKEITVGVLQRTRTPENAELQAQAAELSILRAQLGRMQSDPKQGATEASSYIQRYRDFKYQETLYELIARQYELAKIDESRETGPIQIVDAPTLPEFKSSPKRAKSSIMAFFGTLVICTFFLLVRSNTTSQPNP